MERVGGIIALKVDGELFRAKGNFTYNVGKPKKDAIVGEDGVHGFKEVPVVPFIEGEITDSAEISLESLIDTRNATATLELANGKVIAIQEAFYAGEGTGNTQEGNIPFRVEGISGEEIR